MLQGDFNKLINKSLSQYQINFFPGLPATKVTTLLAPQRLSVAMDDGSGNYLQANQDLNLNQLSILYLFRILFQYLSFLQKIFY